MIHEISFKLLPMLALCAVVVPAGWWIAQAIADNLDQALRAWRHRRETDAD